MPVTSGLDLLTAYDRLARPQLARGGVHAGEVELRGIPGEWGLYELEDVG